jgi:hypothetical protein
LESREFATQNPEIDALGMEVRMAARGIILGILLAILFYAIALYNGLWFGP